MGRADERPPALLVAGVLAAPGVVVQELDGDVVDPGKQRLGLLGAEREAGDGVVDLGLEDEQSTFSSSGTPFSVMDATGRTLIPRRRRRSRYSPCTSSGCGTSVSP